MAFISSRYHKLYILVAGPVGFEPAIEGSEPSALPLGYWPNNNGRDIRIRTRTNGFGDRCATVYTISLNGMYKYSILSVLIAIQTEKKDGINFHLPHFLYL